MRLLFGSRNLCNFSMGGSPNARAPAGTSGAVFIFSATSAQDSHGVWPLMLAGSELASAGPVDSVMTSLMKEQSLCSSRTSSMNGPPFCSSRTVARPIAGPDQFLNVASNQLISSLHALCLSSIEEYGMPRPAEMPCHEALLLLRHQSPFQWSPCNEASSVLSWCLSAYHREPPRESPPRLHGFLLSCHVELRSHGGILRVERWA